MKPVLPSFDAATEDAPRFGSTPTSSDRRRNPRHRAVARGLLLACIASLLSGTARAADSGPSVVASPAAVATVPVDATTSQLVEASGKVEVARSTGVWEPARAGLILLPGHQLRTAAGSRATLQLGDRSVVRIHPSTLVEIRPPAHGTATTARSFLLRWGTLFFLNRERPARVEFETPLSRGAIRGTEFHLNVDPGDATTRLALIDGAVDLTAEDQTVALARGETAEVLPGRPPRKVASLPVRSLIQWTFYYPAVLNPDDLAWSPADAERHARSLAAYRAGNLQAARDLLPADVPDASPSERLYRAALASAFGETEPADALPNFPEDARLASVRGALREIVAVAREDESAEIRPEPIPESASAWLARSYRRQLQRRLPEARAAAREAVRLAPGFGFAWARLAELEFGFGERAASKKARDTAAKLAPEHAAVAALEGFAALEDDEPRRALQEFARATARDASLPLAWVGQGLARAALRDHEEARRAFQIAAALEPRRGSYRGYLAKAFGETRDDALADKDFLLAMELDPADPTAWHDAALHDHQLNRRNQAIRRLETAVERNDNRAVFRPPLLLDQDRAMRGANLAALYDDVGLDEVAYRIATRSIVDDYASFSSHLFLARLLAEREDPARVDLRYETSRQSEWLMANLLAPAGAGNLSQLLSQQDHLRYFAPRPFAGSSFTEYRDSGAWSQAGSLFGQTGPLGYALDTLYETTPGDRPNSDREDLRFSLQTQYHLRPGDSVYFQAAWADAEAGDTARYADPAATSLSLRTDTRQEPHLYAGYHHAWSPSQHTLVLAGHLRDRLHLSDTDHPQLFLVRRGGAVADASTLPGYRLDLDSDVALSTVEAQHMVASDSVGWIAGTRYQDGSVASEARLEAPLPAAPVVSNTEGTMRRFDAYSYGRWSPIAPLTLIAGLGYHDLTYPENADLAPLSEGEEHRSLIAPSAAILVRPWKGGDWRAAYARSLGGLYFDDSIRLEPAQVAGFVQSFRSLLPESVAGIVPGAIFDTWGTRFDQSLPSGTYLGVELLRLGSDGERSVGALTHTSPIPVPDATAQTGQSLDFVERSLALYAKQLLGDSWSVGARYRLSVAELDGRFPDLPSTAPGVLDLRQDERATLGELELTVRYYHACGLFAEWHSLWFDQTSDGASPDVPDTSLWQHHAFVGYRFPRRTAEIRVGLLNLTDEEPGLNPLNLTADPPRARTFYASLRLNF